MATNAFKFRTTANVDRFLLKINRGLLQIDKSTAKMTRDLSVDAERTFQKFAPKRTGRLAEGLQARVLDATRFEIRLRAVSESGYNYAPVTRFGHRVFYIFPKPPRKALHWMEDGTSVFRRGVRGVKHVRDWVQDARFVVRLDFQARFKEMANEIRRGLQ